jgi:hypothetical protein
VQKLNATPFRILGVVHVIVGLLLLPVTMFFGLLLAPVLLPGPVWIVMLGFRLWRPSARVGVLLRRTHCVGMTVAALLCVYGVFALQAAERSAAAGGGLLGAFGLIPLGLGVLLGGTAVTSLWLARGLKSDDRDAG